MSKKNKEKNKKNINTKSPIIQFLVKLVFEFLGKAMKSADKISGNIEMNSKYKFLQKSMEKDFKRLKDRVEKLTIRLYWMNMLIIILTICVVIELFYIIVKF